eukprot:TRINITY_DN7723_c0_g1_i3.p2 TRINITY_DN7723_c0_g1~~TRINITY_DN7723_c0_g1_i3.p2  ORF type:complete len:116 (-),score=27.60 TRINITY_DN7723_c0_g1_i3:232-579(-)
MFIGSVQSCCWWQTRLYYVMLSMRIDSMDDLQGFFFFFFSSRRRHTRCREVSWARRCVQETGYQRRVHGLSWLERTPDKREVDGSSPFKPTTCSLKIAYNLMYIKYNKPRQIYSL